MSFMRYRPFTSKRWISTPAIAPDYMRFSNIKNTNIQYQDQDSVENRDVLANYDTGPRYTFTSGIRLFTPLFRRFVYTEVFNHYDWTETVDCRFGVTMRRVSSSLSNMVVLLIERGHTFILKLSMPFVLLTRRAPEKNSL